MAAGLPLIVPDEGGCAEVADPRCAELYAARDAASAAAAIDRLFGRDPLALRRAALKAARRVRTDREHAVDLIAYYQSVLDQRRAPWASAA